MQVTKTFDLDTAEQVAALTAEAREVGAAMRRIVDAAYKGVPPMQSDLDKANAWLRAVGA